MTTLEEKTASARLFKNSSTERIEVEVYTIIEIKEIINNPISEYSLFKDLNLISIFLRL